MNYLLSWIVLIPLFSACILGFLYLLSLKFFPISRRIFTFIALTSPLLSFLIVVFFFIQMIGNDEIFSYSAYRWLFIEGHEIYMGFMADRLSIFMALFVSFVGWLIHIYASGYMKEDENYGRFFFYFNLFLTSMLMLVLGNGPLIMFIGWEGVGLCSYLLISYYFSDAQNVKAGNKAFIANRIGDFGFIIGMAILLFNTQGINFDFISLEANITQVPSQMLNYAGIAFLLGALAKSAQIPLYVWLPDAMAGPTPVSALIHAATMVTAGIYMIARFHFLYDLIPNVGVFIAYIGAISSIFAALIATKQSDIKKILAYSTMSQLGYMFIGVGLGSYESGLFHVFTHAFFKALLFMGAGAVIVALHHEQNIFKMGALRQKIPLIFYTMLAATLAICGIPPFAGFFSKDEILLVAFEKEQYTLWAIGVITAFLTAYYMFRLFFIVFYGKNSQVKTPLHVIPRSMSIPLVILAFGSIFVGFFGLPHSLGGNNILQSWFNMFGKESLHVSLSTELLLMVLNVFVGFLGIFVAYKKFFAYDLRIEPHYEGVIWNKFYVDEVYNLVVVQGIQKISVFISSFLDKRIINALVMFIATGFISLGNVIGKLQNAQTRFYAFFMVSGVSMLCIYLLVALG
jgi:NADH-quinone oxidoreductase subunit L